MAASLFVAVLFNSLFTTMFCATFPSTVIGFSITPLALRTAVPATSDPPTLATVDAILCYRNGEHMSREISKRNLRNGGMFAVLLTEAPAAPAPPAPAVPAEATFAPPTLVNPPGWDAATFATLETKTPLATAALAAPTEAAALCAACTAI